MLRNATRLFVPMAAMFAFAACGDEEEPKKQPSIVTFTADKMSVTANATVKLTYEVTNANTVRIAANPGGDLTLPAGLKGSVDSAPLTATTEFTLTAVGDGGTATKKLTVVVEAVMNQVQIVSFDANPTTIAVGQSAMLTWSVLNAEAVKITTPSAEIVASGNRFNDTEMVTPTETTVYTLEATGVGGPRTQTVTITVQATPPAPEVTSFTASPNPITAGNSTTLSWVVTNATNVKVTDDSGATVYDGANLTGSQMVTPADTTTYTLEAKNAANETDTQTVVVTVNPVQTGATINSFGANPTAINLGQSTTLSWDVSNAPGGIEISLGATVLHTASAATGTFVATPASAGVISYGLKALNAAGDATASVNVTVTAVGASIVSFTASPTTVAAGGSSTLSWNVTGATRVRVLNGAVVVFDDINVTSNTGSINVTPATTTTYTLEASNANGTATAQVTVSIALAPVIDSFLVEPASFTGSTTATVTWETTDATSTQLWVNGVAVSGFPGTPDGSYSWVVSQTSAVRLSATNGPLSVQSTVATIAAVISGVGTNTSSATAMALPGDGTGVSGEVLVADEEDWYAVTVPAGYGIHAYTDCVVDSQIYVFDSAMNQLAFDDDGGPDFCSDVAPATDVGVRDLPAGTYFIMVRGYTSDTGAYTLFVNLVEPACGNGYRESRAGEECDDGNATAGDGCDSLCAFEGTFETEPNNSTATAVSLTAPASASGSIDPTTDPVDFFSVNVPAGYHLFAQVGINGFDSCPFPASATLTLYDSDGTTILATNSSGGPGHRCGRLAPDTAEQTVGMLGGTYYIAVSDLNDDEAIGAYFLHVEVLAPGCGNGFVEAAESCDDGNTTAGDGCDATCALEAAGVVVGPATTPTTIPGALAVGELDIYRIDMTSAGFIRAETFVPSAPDCDAVTGSSDTVIELTDQAGNLLASNDEHPDLPRSCSLIDPRTDAGAAVGPGTYFLRVYPWNSLDEITAYEVVIFAFGPGCGNGVTEPALEQCDDGNLASGDGCSATCTFEGVTETEPNNDFTTANAADPVPGTFAGALDPTAGDVSDFWSVVVPADYSLLAQVATDANGGCPDSATLRLYDVDGSTILAEDDWHGVDSNCGRLAPEVNVATKNLPAGTYFIEVTPTFGDTLPVYFLTIETVAPICGNGIVDPGESCDDSNTTDADGCSALCTLEVLGTYTFPVPGGPQIFTDGIDPETQVDFYAVQLGAPAYLAIETFDDAVSGTCSIDTVIRLYDEQRNEIFSDDEDGTGSCSRIFPNEAFVPAGNYFVSVESWLGFSTIPTYQLVIDARPVDICGNGITEVTVAEQCDDGNLNANDGCSATCQWEILGALSAPFATGTIIGLPAAEYRLFQVDITLAGTSVAIVSHDSGDPGTCTVDTHLYLIDSASLLVAEAGAGGPGDCGALNVSDLDVGTYYLAVVNEGTVVGDVEVEATFSVAACGNGVVEGSAGETCDDGNLISGDGCSDTCQFEGLSESEPNNDPFDPTTPTFDDSGLAAVGSVTVLGVLPAGVGERDYFKVEVPVGQTLNLTAHTYLTLGDPTSVCPSGTIDTAVKVWTNVGDELSFVDDDDYPANLCSTAAAAGLTEGTYYVSVANWEFESGSGVNQGGDMTYFLDLTLAP